MQTWTLYQLIAWILHAERSLAEHLGVGCGVTTLSLSRAPPLLQISVLNGDKKMISAVDATPAGIS